MNTTESNNLLAEFMGFEKETDPTQRFYGNWFTQPTTAWGIRLELLHFDTDWNWLMQVVEKIESLGYRVAITEFKTEISNEVISINSWKEKIKIANTHNACVEFVKWYNEQKK